MLVIGAGQYRRALLMLGVGHVVIIAASNYLVQLPITLLGVQTTWAAFSFPFIFLATDLTVRLFGKEAGRRIVFAAMVPALAVSYAIGTLFEQGDYRGLTALMTLDWFVARIAIASFMAYTLGQLLDIHVFDRLRRNAHWWMAPTVSTVFGNLADTIAFFGIAFYASPNAFMAAQWPQLAAVDYASKLVISLTVFVPAYGALLRRLQRHLIGPDGGVQVVSGGL